MPGERGGAPPPLWLLTGPSGAGRTTALAALERAGVARTENLPAALLGALAGLPRTAASVVTLAPAVLPGAAEPGAPPASPDGLAVAVREAGVGVLYLDADDRTLVRRLADSTRPHPCAAAGPGLAAVSAERELLSPLRAVADAVIDTTDLLPGELGRRVLDIVRPAAPAASAFAITISSFGFKYGPQVEADWVVDVRFLPNPFWEPELRPLTGLDAAVAAYVMASAEGPELVERLAGLLTWVAARSEAHGRTRVHIALGCTGGRHRSVAVATALAERLVGAGKRVSVRHRDVDRPDPRQP